MIGTMVLVLMGCGSAVFAGSVAGTVGAGVGTIGIALAFGLSVVAMAYAIGLSLVLIHIVCIPITGTSVNPARSIAPALFQGGEALSQLWLFIVAPFVGAALSALVWNYFDEKE